MRTGGGNAGQAVAGDIPGHERLVAIARALFAQLAANPALNTIELPDGLGVCLIHTVRGGGKIYVAPDGSVYFAGSAVDFDAGLKSFRAGARTDPRTFNSAGSGPRTP